MEFEEKINNLEKKLERYHSVYVFTTFFILLGLSFWLIVALPNIPNFSNPLSLLIITASLIAFFCFVALILLLGLIFILKDDSKQD